MEPEGTGLIDGRSVWLWAGGGGSDHSLEEGRSLRKSCPVTAVKYLTTAELKTSVAVGVVVCGGVDVGDIGGDNGGVTGDWFFQSMISEVSEELMPPLRRHPLICMLLLLREQGGLESAVSKRRLWADTRLEICHWLTSWSLGSTSRRKNKVLLQQFLVTC